MCRPAPPHYAKYGADRADDGAHRCPKAMKPAGAKALRGVSATARET